MNNQPYHGRMETMPECPPLQLAPAFDVTHEMKPSSPREAYPAPRWWKHLTPE